MWGPNRGNTLGWGYEPTPKEEPMATTEELRGAAVEAASRVNTGGVVGRVASAVDALAAAATALATGGTYEHLVEGEVETTPRVPTPQGDSQGGARGGADAGLANTAVSNPVTPVGLIEARREGSDGGSEAFTLEAMVAAAEASESGDQTPASGLIEPEGLIQPPEAEPGIHEEAPEAEEAPAKVPPKLTFVMKRPERARADGETRHAAREALEEKEKSLREKLATTAPLSLDLDANPSEEDAQLCGIDGVEHVEHVEHMLRPVVNDGDPPPPTQLCRCVPRVPTGWRRWETIRAKPNANGSMAADCYYRTPDDPQGSRSYVLRSEKEIEEFLSEDAAPNGSNRFSSGEQLVSVGMFWCRPFTRARTGGKRRARTGMENVPGEAGRAPKTHKWRAEHPLGGVDAATPASHEVGSPRVEEPARDPLKDTTEEEERGSSPPPVDAAPEPQPEPEPGLFVHQLAALPSPAPPPTQPVTQRPVTTPPPSSPPPGPIAHTAAAVPDDIEAMREQIRAQLKEELRAQVEAELRREIAAEYVTARNAADEDARAERVMHESK